MVSIALFGLSANPPTGESGHVGIVRALVQTGRFDEIWILPVYQHMYSSKRNLAPYDHRMEMCRLAFVPESSTSCAVKVMTTEKEAYEAEASKRGTDVSTVRVGTIDVIKFIKSQYSPGKAPDLSLVLGSDTFTDIMSGKWKDSQGYVTFFFDGRFSPSLWWPLPTALFPPHPLHLSSFLPNLLISLTTILPIRISPYHLITILYISTRRSLTPTHSQCRLCPQHPNLRHPRGFRPKDAISRRPKGRK